MATNTIYPYFVNEDNEAYIFSALNVECTAMDFDKALNEGEINDQYKNALVANTYGGATPEKPVEWLQLT